MVRTEVAGMRFLLDLSKMATETAEEAELRTLAIMGHGNCRLVGLDVKTRERVYSCDDCGEEHRFNTDWKPSGPQTKAVWSLYTAPTRAERRRTRTGPAGSWRR